MSKRYDPRPFDRWGDAPTVDENQTLDTMWLQGWQLPPANRPLRAGDGFTELQLVVQRVYGLPNDRSFDLSDLLINATRFTMRAVKAVRRMSSGQKSPRTETRRAVLNLAIAFSWFTSSVNRLHLDLDAAVWRRFPYYCTYCGGCPCTCPRRGVHEDREKPRSLFAYQQMFGEIYPPSSRQLLDATVHMAEEVGEYTEALMQYGSRHDRRDLEAISMEAADYVSCVFGVFNSLDRPFARELVRMFKRDCHVCGSAPCQCDFYAILDYKS